MVNCLFCNKPLADGPTVTLGTKGCEGISKASLERESNIVVKPGDVVHKECRKAHCHPTAMQSFKRKRASECATESSRTLRSKESFSYSDNCLFCGTTDKYHGKKKQFELIPVRTLEFDTAKLKACDERSDEWSEKIKGRVLFTKDLHAADAVYHQAYSVNFRTGKNIPQLTEYDNSSKKQRVGRPEDSLRAEAFQKFTLFLEEHDEEQVTITDLIKQMNEFLDGSNLEPYGFTHMKEKLLDHFGDKIVVTEINGTQNVVTLRHTASAMLRDFYQQPKDIDPETEKLRLIKAAANRVKSDIKTSSQLSNPRTFIQLVSPCLPSQRQLTFSHSHCGCC